MKFAIMTDTLPPTIGGMQTITHELILQFQREHRDFIVITTTRNAAYLFCADRDFPLFPVMSVIEDSFAHNLMVVQKVLHKEKVEVILALDAGYISLAKELAYPMVATLNGNDFLKPFNAFCRDGSRNMHDKRKAISENLHCVTLVANSELTRDMFTAVYQYSRTNYFKDRHSTVKVVYLGLSPQLLDLDVLDAKVYKPSRAYNVLTVARLDANAQRKNIYNLIDAVKFLELTPKAVAPPMCLTIMGSGDRQSEIQAYIDSCGMSDVVKIVTDAQYMSAKWFECYRAADVLVMVPTEFEGFGLVYLEAQAFGVPVIARNPEVMLPNLTGIVCSRTDAKSIATAINECSRLVWERQSIHAFAKAFSIARYSSELYKLLEGRYDRSVV